MWYQIFNQVSRFQSGTKYSFKLERRIVSIIASIIVSIIAGIIVGRTIVRVQASKYGCHIPILPEFKHNKTNYSFK